MNTETSLSSSELAREVLAWLTDNEDGQFNITCQRCHAPFAHEGQPVAAPAEWFGGLDWEKQLAEAVIRLENAIRHELGMTHGDDTIRRLRAALESTPANGPDFSGANDRLCRCGGYQAGDHNFDRSICMCGSMHYYCNRCGGQGDECAAKSPNNA